VNVGFRELRKEVHWCFIVFPEERIKVNIATLQYLLVVFYPGNEQFIIPALPDLLLREVYCR